MMKRRNLAAIVSTAALLAACASAPETAETLPLAETEEAAAGDPVPRYPALAGPFLASGLLGL